MVADEAENATPLTSTTVGGAQCREDAGGGGGRGRQ